MSLDLYVGPLCRYHAGDWKTIGQIMAEAQGIPYQIVTPDGQPLEEMASMEEVVESIGEWQGRLRDVLTKAGESGELWDDTPEMGYATDRPGWPGWTALVLKYAYLLRPELPEPTTVPPDETLFDDPAFVAANAEPSLFQVIALCELWIPGRFEFMFRGQTITGKDVMISSSELLTAAIDELCRLWGKDRLALADLSTSQPLTGDPLDEAALHGLALLSRLTAEMKSRNLPMILDY